MPGRSTTTSVIFIRLIRVSIGWVTHTRRRESHHPDAVLSARDRSAAGAPVRARERAGASGPRRHRAHRDAELPRGEDLPGVRWPPTTGAPRRGGGHPHGGLPHPAGRFPGPARELLLVRV